MARIPGAQAHYSGSYSDLEQFLGEREIGLCDDDDVVYIKNTEGDLVPVGIKYYAGSGISITDSTDPERPGKVISCASAVYTPNEGSPVSGVLSVTQAQNGNLGVKVGNVSSGLGFLVPAVPESSTGKVLTVGDNGGLQWNSLPDVAPSFYSRAPTYVWYADEVCTYDGELYMFDADHSGEWTGQDVHEVTLLEAIRMLENPTIVIAGELECDSYTYTNDARNASVRFSAGRTLDLCPVGGSLGGAYSAIHTLRFRKDVPLKIRKGRLVTPGSMGIGMEGTNLQPSPGNIAAQLVIQAYYENNDTSVQYFGHEHMLKFMNYNEWTTFNFEMDCSSFEWDFYYLRVMSGSVTGGGIPSIFYIDDSNLQTEYVGQPFKVYLELEIDRDCEYVQPDTDVS